MKLSVIERIIKVEACSEYASHVYNKFALAGEKESPVIL